MIYTDFQDKKLSMLGFGAMRLPMTEGTVDEALVHTMVDRAIEGGINYFDTAYPYHGGMSEEILGRALARHPREAFYLADKFPGHQTLESYDPALIFEEQLRRCGVEYFDFYLLHNVYEKSLEIYLNPEYGIIPYFLEQKRLGRIKHLGFSTHGQLETVERFLDLCGKDMEFCQIQLNYLDWTLQQGEQKCQLLRRYGIPIWVMEPVRGGKLASFENDALKKARPQDSTASWGFRFLQDIPGVRVILSGMSDLAQLQDNLKTFDRMDPLSDAERATVLSIAETMKDAIPCTGCRYCCDGCPMGLDIPTMMRICGDIRFAPVVNSVMMIQALPQDKQPSACIACGKCTKVCPQGIDIPAVMAELAQRLRSIPSWEAICQQRILEQKNRRSQ